MFTEIFYTVLVFLVLWNQDIYNNGVICLLWTHGLVRFIVVLWNLSSIAILLNSTSTYIAYKTNDVIGLKLLVSYHAIMVGRISWKVPLVFSAEYRLNIDSGSRTYTFFQTVIVLSIYKYQSLNFINFISWKRKYWWLNEWWIS